MKCVAPTLSGARDGTFWAILVPQLCHSNTTVLNAVLTISALYENPQTSSTLLVGLRDSPLLASGPTYSALTWYAKTLGGLQRFDLAEQFPVLELLGCLLVTTIEFQLNNVVNALTLLHKGCNLLQNLLAAPDVSQKHTALAPIREVIVPLFVRNTVFAAPFAQPPPSEWTATASAQMLSSAPLHISSLEDARMKLYTLMHEGHKLVRFAELRKIDDVALNNMVPLHDLILRRLTEWHNGLLMLSLPSDRSATRSTQNCMASLLIYYEVLHICVSCCLSPLETAFDAYETSFKSTLQYIEQLREDSDATASVQLSGYFEGGALPPVFFVASKCRHRETRRRALALLHQIGNVGGIWAAIPVQKIARTIIEIEEEDLISYETRFGDACLPDETQRIQDLDIMRITTSGAAPSSMKVIQHSRDAWGQITVVERTINI